MQSGITNTNQGGQRDLEEVGAGEEHVVVGTFDDPNTNDTSTFFATNVTKAQVFNLGFTKSKECTDEAHNNAMIVKVSEERLISTDTPGAKGWHLQRVSQLDDGELSTVFALADLITGADSNYTLVSYFYDLEKNLLACAHLKKHDEDTAAMYDELLEEVVAGAAAESANVVAGGDEAAVEDTSSGSKVGLFVFLSAFAAVGIAAVLGDILAL